MLSIVLMVYTLGFLFVTFFNKKVLWFNLIDLCVK